MVGIGLAHRRLTELARDYVVIAAARNVFGWRE
jgi:hypothetical protein